MKANEPKPRSSFTNPSSLALAVAVASDSSTMLSSYSEMISAKRKQESASKSSFTRGGGGLVFGL